MLRHILLGTMRNLRDLGGYPTADGRCTRYERILRGDLPQGFTGRDADWLLRRNITTVVDLRSRWEAENRPCALRDLPGFTYRHHVLAGGETPPNAEDDVAGGYFRMLDRTENVLPIMSAIADAGGGVLFHCTAGKDRTGCVAALLLACAGVGLDDILADYQISETYMLDWVRQAAAQMPDKAAFVGRSKSEYMEGCLDLVNAKYDGVEGYLRAVGLTDGQLGRLRGKLLDTD
ncbi:tyrosine-protein phosphatase [Pseudoflavonifractor phocaeensis]|uniref:tyrosine-protein phosphatase n=1 Tax=Pseudoflavonifractor phocaeensis TaxID=1870988 RepID=UPI00210F0A22|nr:tyrosine-protein phosphatase [Pseudoflavonifractor phocaeensis]